LRVNQGRAVRPGIEVVELLQSISAEGAGEAGEADGGHGGGIGAEGCEELDEGVAFVVPGWLAGGSDAEQGVYAFPTAGVDGGDGKAELHEDFEPLGGRGDIGLEDEVTPGGDAVAMAAGVCDAAGGIDLVGVESPVPGDGVA
jgi:hypothetical protein